jgi:sec-independent protein translocase protein TatB
VFGLGWAELAVIGLVGFFVFGPERLPTLARDAARGLRALRGHAEALTRDLRQDLPSVSDLGLDDLRDLRDLHPRRLVTRALFDDEDEAASSPPTTPAGARSYERGSPPPWDVDAT